VLVAVADQRTPTPPVLRVDNPLSMPQVGGHEVRIVSPTLLEVWLVTTKSRGAAPERWSLVDESGAARLPPVSELSVLADEQPLEVRRVGFKRRVLYAPIARRDLRIGNSLFLELGKPVPPGAHVRVLNPSGALWPSETAFEATASPLRLGPAIHVNQLGFTPSEPKKALVGYYLGSLGEMHAPPEGRYTVVDAATGDVVHSGALRRRGELEQPYAVKPYQQVLEADFGALSSPGQYRVVVAGLGASYPFVVDEGVAAAFARTFALGLYHQRCGEGNALPFTRFTHGPCHTAPADVPTAAFASVAERLAGQAKEAPSESRPIGAPVRDVGASVVPFVRGGKVDVSGGHHDAGDYGKYTFNSAQLVHELVFAVDALPGVADLDNLGLPESGDGTSDVLEEAKKEADYLAKMQDSDGGFYYLVQPRDRTYESDVPPDRGDPQAVFPKNTVATAAAVAALAQAGSSPALRAAFPSDAGRYLAAARRGWELLERVEARHGADGSYQRVGHYGQAFLHDDEIAWAATELFLATGEQGFHTHLLRRFDPSDPRTRHWTWVRLFEGYGNAIRSYAYGARTGRLAVARLDGDHLAKCEREIVARGRELAAWSAGNAYGTSFPFESKRHRSAGWYFSSANLFDLAVANVLAPRADLQQSMASNLAYDAGANPIDVSFVTGIGQRRQREVVHQFAQTDRRVLPPTGLALGGVQAGFSWNGTYGDELRKLSFPSDDDRDAPYALYDRWADTHNVTTEFTVEALGRALAGTAYLMAQTPLKTQRWRSAPGRIALVPTPSGASADVRLRLEADGLDLTGARIVWEADGIEPSFGAQEVLLRGGGRGRWVEAEAMLPDGRRVFAVLAR
jgi:hypothetical protein